MPYWYELLLAFLAEQPPETTSVTFTFDELAALAAAPIPDSAYEAAYWWGRHRGTMGYRLRVVGWRVAGMHEGMTATVAFARLPPDTTV